MNTSGPSSAFEETQEIGARLCRLFRHFRAPRPGVVDVKRRARHTIAKGFSEHGCQNLRPHRDDNEDFQR